MAEEYLIGTNRIVYRSTSFEEGLDIFVDMYCPNGSREPSIILTEIDDGLYYFRYNFSKVGVYTGIFYEKHWDDELKEFVYEKKVSQNFRITRKDVSSSSGLRPFLGDNVINT